MPRNGSGQFSLASGNPVAGGATISSTTHNSTMSDIADALTASLAKNGETTPTANLPMGGYRHTNVDDAGARTDYARADQVQDGTLVYLTSVSGTNTVTATAPLSLAAYAAGQCFRLIPANTNTGATTLNISSIGAKNIYSFGAALVGGELQANVPATVIYDGTRFHLCELHIQPGIERVGSYSATGGTSLDIETGINSTRYVAYILNILYLYPGTNATTLKMRIKRSGSYQTTGYSTMLAYTNSGAYPSTPLTPSTSGLISDGWEISPASGASSTAANAFSGQIVFSNPHNATSYMAANGDGVIVGSGGGTNIMRIGGYYGGGGGLEGVRLFASSGNVTALVNLYGLRA